MTQNRVKQLGLMNSAMKLRVPLEARNLLDGPATATFSIKALSCGAIRVQGINPNFVNRDKTVAKICLKIPLKLILNEQDSYNLCCNGKTIDITYNEMCL